MGQTIELTAADGFKLSAYRADPAGTPRGGIVVAQEIFGVNSHIRSVCDGYAADGYVVIAPALFDRYERGVDIGYTPADIAKGRELKAQAQIDAALRDVAAARDALASAGKVGVIGYCWGGYRRVDDGVAPAGIRVRDPVLRRRHSGRRRRAAAVPADGALRRARRDDSRGRRARARRRPIPTRRSTPTPRTTASTAISGGPTTPRRRSSRASARCSSCSATSAESGAAEVSDQRHRPLLAARAATHVDRAAGRRVGEFPRRNDGESPVGAAAAAGRLLREILGAREQPMELEPRPDAQAAAGRRRSPPARAIRRPSPGTRASRWRSPS